MKRIMRTSGRFFLFSLAFAALACPTGWAAPEAGQDKGKKEEVVWGEMPAGAKTTYIGIHGGTVPVSLLTAGDGSPMIALVGLTGSDFLHFLRSKGKMAEDPPTEAPAAPAASGPVLPPAPSSNATLAQAPAAPSPEAQTEDLPATPLPVPSESNATLLLAGSPSGDIPVIYATGRAFERMSLVPANWAPFGLTEKALSVEGEVKVLTPPKKLPKKYQKKKRRG